jgi:hypothetical protein
MPIEIIATIRDRSGDEATTSVRVPSSSTYAQLGAFAVGWATALNNFIAGKILSVVAYDKPTVSSLTNNTLLDAADVEHIAKFSFLTVGGKRVLFNVPAMNEVTLSSDDSDALDQAVPATAALIAAMLNGIATVGGTISPCDVGEESLTDVLFAREAFKNSGARR